MGNVGNLQHCCGDALLDFRHVAIEALDPLADRAHLLPQSRKSLLILRGADALRGAVALRLQRLALLQQCAAFAVPSHEPVNHAGIFSTSREARLDFFCLLTYAAHVEHYSASRVRTGGKSITSRIEALFVKIIAMRSMPIPIPPVGGMPYSNASRKSSSRG